MCDGAQSSQANDHDFVAIRKSLSLNARFSSNNQKKQAWTKSKLASMRGHSWVVAVVVLVSLVVAASVFAD